MSNDAGHTNEDLFRLYGIEPNKRTSGRLELELRCRIRRLRLLLSELRAPTDDLVETATGSVAARFHGQQCGALPTG